MKYGDESELALAIAAFGLVAHALPIGREFRVDDWSKVAHQRLRLMGYRDEAMIAEQLKTYKPMPLLATIDHLNAHTFKMSSGLPAFRMDRGTKGVCRIVSPDLLRCLHTSLRLPADEAYNWSAIPAWEKSKLALSSETKTVETHIHLGGALPPLYFWTMMMSGGLMLSQLKSTISEEEDLAHLALWQQAIHRARWLRLWFVRWLRDHCPSGETLPFPHLPDLADISGLEVLDHLKEETPSEPFREISFRLLEETVVTYALKERHPQEWPLLDPLRTPAHLVDRRVHYGEGERRLLVSLRRTLDEGHDITEASRQQCLTFLEEYLGTQNAYHRLMAYVEGTGGLMRFVESFGQRGALSMKRGNSRRGRGTRARRLNMRLERNRMATALNEQLTRTFEPGPVAEGQHRIEIRVTLPGKGSGTLYVLRAWLAGIHDHLQDLKTLTPGPPYDYIGKLEKLLKRMEHLVHGVPRTPENADEQDAAHREMEELQYALVKAYNQAHSCHVGLIFHFPKRGDRSLESSLNHAQRLAWLLKAYPGLRPFVVGIDAAGRERGTRPRIFGPAYALLQSFADHHRAGPGRRGVNLGYTYHVGEDVDDFLVGLRHVGEVSDLLLPEERGRLGHALILGHGSERFYRERGNTTEPKRGEYLLSLIWAWGLMKGRDDAIASIMEDWIAAFCNCTELGNQRKLDVAEIRKCHELLNARSFRYRDQTYQPSQLLPDLIGEGTEIAFGHDENYLLNQLTGGNAPEVHWEERIPVKPAKEDFVVLDRIQAALREHLGDLNICIEANPSSNLLLGGFQGYHDLPYTEMVAAGLPLSINTDDPGMFMTMLSNEFVAVYSGLRERGMKHAEAVEWIEARQRDALKSTFLPRVPPQLGGRKHREQIFMGC